MLSKTIVIVVVLIVGVAFGYEVKYNGHKVITAFAKNELQFNTLMELAKTDLCIFWSKIRRNSGTDIMLLPKTESNVFDILARNKMSWFVKITDVGEIIEVEQSKQQLKAFSSRENNTMSWDMYHSFDTLELWMNSLGSHPLVQVIPFAKSYENRTIYLIKISTGNSSSMEKRSILLDSNIHACEWIASATSTWFINELISNFTLYEEILKEVDFYFIPMANPDGYVYSQTVDRLWRKTRNINEGSNCIGTDPNRNFEFKWGGEMTSPDPCSNFYHGSAPFSEPESRAIRDALYYAQNNSLSLDAYLALHSYGQFWMLSWGYTQGEYPDDYAQLLDWGHLCISKLQALRGTIYVAGQGADIFYGVGGGSDDFAKVNGVKYAVTWELPDTLDGEYGFILPPEQIIPTAQESFEAFMETAKTVIGKPSCSIS